MSTTNPLRFLLLYVPFMLAWLFSEQYHISYITSWLGSFFIYYISYSGLIKKLPNDHSLVEQLMRPIFLLQIIFAGYMCCSSIFYYVNALGYQYLEQNLSRLIFGDEIYRSIGRCQLYYVLGHAALTHGILIGMKYPIEKKYVLYTASMSNLLIGISVVCLPLGYFFGKIGGLNQFSVQLTGLSFVAGTIALAFAIKEQKKTNLWFAGALFISNLLNSLVSGYKEPILISVILLGVFLLPIYGKKVAPIFVGLLIVLIFILPTFINNFRQLSGQGVNSNQARDESFDAVFNSNQEDLEGDNWEFLVFRFSEIDMFIKYTNSTPRQVPYYKLQLLKDGIISIIPRFFWPSKPIVEDLVMQRVYSAGVVDRQSLVSAKPAYIVDAYLSYGMIGIWISLFLYGYVAQWISIKAEILFGGYFMGSAVMFAGLFQIFWRGNSFEFLISAIFWSFVTMYIIYIIFKAKGILERV